MSEENKDQQGQQQDGGQEELILGKFKTQQDLIDSYKSLERKLHDRPEPNKEGDKTKVEPPKDEHDWMQKNAALDAQEALVAKRKQEAGALLADDRTLQDVRAALGSPERIKEFQEDFDKGNVSAAEVRRLAGLRSTSTPDATTTIPESEKESKDAGEDETTFLMKHLNSPNSPYFDPKHPQHKQVKEQVNAVKQKLGM